jgi:CheY-like chemotaxis protein
VGFQALVCEDDAAARRWLADCLADRGISVVQAGTGLEAIRLADSSPPDLIFLDMVLPDVDSVAVIRKWSAEPKTAEVPVVGLAPSGWIADKLSGVQIAGLIPKPVSEKGLEDCLREVCPGLCLPTSSEVSVLLFDESGKFCSHVDRCLREAGLRALCIAHEFEALEAMSEPAMKFAFVILSKNSAVTERVLQRLVGREPPLRVVVVADHLNPDEVRALGALGVHEILVRPLSNARLSRAVQRALADPADPTDGKSKRVLLVEDAVLVAKTMCALLEQAGYSVVHAASAESALKVMQESRPQFMLLDVILPGMDGVEFVHRMQQSDLWVPFAVVTGARDPRRMSALQSLGALRVFEKPVHSDELLVFMDNYFACAQPAAQE